MVGLVSTMNTTPRARSDGVGGLRAPHSGKAKKGTPAHLKKKNNEKLGPDDLEFLVEENPELFEALVEKARKKRAMGEALCLDSADFIQKYEETIENRMTNLVGNVLYQYIIEEDARTNLLRDPESQALAFETFKKSFDFTEYQAVFDNILSSVFEKYQHSIDVTFLEPYFKDTRGEPQGRRKVTDSKVQSIQEKSKNDDSPQKQKPKQGSKRTPQKVVLSSPARSALFDSSEEDEDLEQEVEDEDSNIFEGFEDEDSNEGGSGDENPKATQCEIVLAPSDESKKRTHDLMSQESGTGDNQNKKKRGRPRKGPKMELRHGMKIKIHDVVKDAWTVMTISGKNSACTITMTDAKKSLSAGNLKPLDD